jgi:hypothetical protein
MKTYVMNDVQNPTKCSCRYLKCLYDGKRFIDNLIESGIVQLPSIKKVNLAFCKNCCDFACLNATCADCVGMKKRKE